MQNRENNIIDFEELDKFINEKNMPNRTHFTITITSLKADIKYSYNFDGIWHFDNWFKRIISGEVATDSQGTKIIEESPDLMRGDIKVDVDIISGGCNKHTQSKIKKASPFYEFDLINPTSENNNCLFACLKIIKPELNSLSFAKMMRKKFNIPSNTEINIEDAYLENLIK